MKRGILLYALSILLIAAVVPAVAKPRLVTGSVSQSRVNDLTSQIQWNTSLSQALEEARREGKLVFWVHMLGDIKGAT